MDESGCGFAPSTPAMAWTSESFGAYMASEAPKFVEYVLSSLDALKSSESSSTDQGSFDKMQIKNARQWTLDHVCYRCETEEEYNHLSTAVLPAMATLLVESEVGGRPIATFKLREAILLGNGKSVDVLEVPMPKPGSFYKRGLEHAEIVVPFDLDKFVEANEALFWDLKGMTKASNREARIALGPDYNVKFHEQTLETVIADELRALRHE
ncbi:YecM protein [Achlya hypogyna]|uniref:YecM protein n=1 Tax=Achlya hypogyna TaxID=1202772 RepID=A0A1V9YFE9_ACHHY|nr:YecM protein [Achlya hypogyna]